MGLDIDIRPEFDERTIEMEGGIVRKVEAFAEFVREREGDVSFDHVVEYLVEKVLTESEARDYVAYRKWRRGETESSEATEGTERSESENDAKDGGDVEWDEETGEMERPVDTGPQTDGTDRRKTRMIRRDGK